MRAFSQENASELERVLVRDEDRGAPKCGGYSLSVATEDLGRHALPGPHDVNNRYQWSNTSTDPDGGAFTDFLAGLGAKSIPLPKVCFADRCDWRLPEISELQL